MAIVVGAHALVLLAWPQRELTTASADARSSHVIFVIAAAKNTPSPALRPRSVMVMRQPLPVKVAPPQAISAPPEAPSEQEIPAVSSTVIVERALRDAGKIDRELRKTSLNAAELKLTYGKTRHELAFAGEGTRIEEMETADGRRMSKVITRWGRYCAQKELNSG